VLHKCDAVIRPVDDGCLGNIRLGLERVVHVNRHLRRHVEEDIRSHNLIPPNLAGPSRLAE